VVVKRRKLENWLAADPHALKKMPKRFKVTRSFEKAVSPNKADSVRDAEALLDRIAIGQSFHKRTDARKIAARQNPLRVAANSRSFRRFLRLAEHPTYAKQSARPAK